MTELSAAERATVERFEQSPDALAETALTDAEWEALADVLGAELYESLMEASADQWRRWRYLTDFAKEQYRAEAERIIVGAFMTAVERIVATRAAEAADAREAEVLNARGIRNWRPGDGDTRCQDCGQEYRPWFTDNWLWNTVMGGEDCGGDPGGYLCPRCFADRADEQYDRIIWRFIPEWSGRAPLMDFHAASAPADKPYICRHGKLPGEHDCDDLRDHGHFTALAPADNDGEVSHG